MFAFLASANWSSAKKAIYGDLVTQTGVHSTQEGGCRRWRKPHTGGVEGSRYRTGTGRMTTGPRLNRTKHETKAPTKNHNQIPKCSAMIIGGGRVGGVGAIVCGCCSSGRVYWGTRVGRGIAGCRQTCVAERVFRSVLRGVLGVVLCWASCCVGRRVVV